VIYYINNLVEWGATNINADNSLKKLSTLVQVLLADERMIND